MSEKVYQLSSDQIGVIGFDKPWFLCHIGVNNDQHQVNLMTPTIEMGIKDFPKIFTENVINVWLTEGQSGIDRIARLRSYILTTWWNPGVETMRKAMFEQYGAPEFRDKTGQELINEGYDFMALVIGHIALRLNKKHFWFEGMHLAAHVVDKFLAVNFWDNAKQEALNLIGTTVFK